MRRTGNKSKTPLAPVTLPDPGEFSLLVGASGGGGSVTASGISTPTDNSENYPEDTVVVLTASASAGKVFDRWSGNAPTGHETDNPLLLTMDSNKWLDANFVDEDDPDPPPPPPSEFTLLAGRTGNGEVTGPGINTATNDTSQNYPAGTNVTLTATADTGSSLDIWNGNIPAADNKDNPLSFVMDQNRWLQASFVVQPDPGGSNPVEDHWGAILYQDLGTDTSACNAWGNQSTAGYNGNNPTDAASDPYVQRIAETGTWIPHGQVSPSTHYRRLITPQAPPQAIHDSGPKPWPESQNATTRAHLFSRGWATTAKWTLHNGDRAWTVLTFKVMSNPPISRGIQSGGGNNYNTQLCQWKSRNSAGYSGVDAVMVGNNGIHFDLGPHNPEGPEFYDPVLCPHGVWHRIAIEQMISNDPSTGYFRCWVQLDGESSWRAAGPKRFLANLPTANGWRNFGLGPYHDIRLCTDNTLYRCDYRDIQIIRYV